MRAFLILEDGTVFAGEIGSTREVISEIVFNTSMTGYLEVLTDPSYAGQAVVMTYPLIGTMALHRTWSQKDRGWTDISSANSAVSQATSRCEGTIQDFLKEHDIPGICVLIRALTKILRDKEP